MSKTDIRHEISRLRAEIGIIRTIMDGAEEDERRLAVYLPKSKRGSNVTRTLSSMGDRITAAKDCARDAIGILDGIEKMVVKDG